MTTKDRPLTLIRKNRREGAELISHAVFGKNSGFFAYTQSYTDSLLGNFQKNSEIEYIRPTAGNSENPYISEIRNLSTPYVIYDMALDETGNGWVMVSDENLEDAEKTRLLRLPVNNWKINEQGQTVTRYLKFLPETHFIKAVDFDVAGNGVVITSRPNEASTLSYYESFVPQQQSNTSVLPTNLAHLNMHIKQGNGYVNWENQWLKISAGQPEGRPIRLMAPAEQALRETALDVLGNGIMVSSQGNTLFFHKVENYALTPIYRQLTFPEDRGHIEQIRATFKNGTGYVAGLNFLCDPSLSPCQGTALPHRQVWFQKIDFQL